jgi:small subunit ribosomal protein S20
VKKLANIKSAKKRILVAAKRQARNKHVKSYTKTAIKKFMQAVNAGDTANINALYVSAVSAVDKAATKGVIHKNTASRKKSQLTKLATKAV